MRPRVIAAVLVIAMAILAYVGWTKYKAPPPAQAPATEPAPAAPEMAGGALPGGGGMPSAEAADPGLAWEAPKRWALEPPRPMRVATYSIPAARGDSAGAVCAVYYFGPGQGGSVDANIERWIGEFENPSVPLRATREVRGVPIARIEVAGTYLSHGATMQQQGTKPNYKLLGAIAQGPGGSVFFKLTGPVKTVDAARREFDGMLESMRRT
jgi:hypothetical protein